MADRPARQRVAVEQGPDEAGFGRRNDGSDLLVPARKGSERSRDRGAVGPVLAVPFVVLGPADKIEEPSAGHEIVHKMRAGTDPGLRAALEPEIGDALGRHEPAKGDAAGKVRRLLTKERNTHRPVDAVRA